MLPERLIDLLAQLVADKRLTEEQAATILLHWREIAGLETVLPLSAGEGVRLEERDAAEYWGVLAAVAGYLLLSGARDAAAAYRRLRSMGPQTRVASANRVQDAHAGRARRLAEDLAAGRITVAEWQRQMRRLNALTLDVLLTLGASGPAAGLQGRRQEEELEQAAFLQRFADHLAGNLLATALAATLGMSAQRWTMDYIARRAAMYSGAGRALFFEAWETGGGDGGDSGPGWVIRYEARDDDRTCSACLAAQGYYLPGDGPMPGEVCYGGGACRCERVPVYDPARWSGLMGVGVKA